jgi:hypothetical protein
MDPRTDNGPGTPGTKESPVVLPTKEARQGGRGTPVMWVLIGGLVLVVIAYFVIFNTVPTPTTGQQ